MRRTDEAFKNELFRRYEQYKKNRRNLRFLAATPVLASVMIVCALVFLPYLKLWQTSGDPIGEQPGEQPDITEQPGNQGAPLEVEPDHPFYDLLGQLEYTDVNSISLTSSFTRLAVELEDAMIDPFMTRLTNTLLTIPYDELAEYEFDGETYAISIRGNLLHSEIGENLPVASVSHNFTLSVGGEFICCDGGRWYRTAPNSAKALVDTLNSLYEGMPAPTLPSITDDEMQALVDAGASFHDLVALIGDPHREVGCGFYIPAWDLADGRTLLVWADLSPSSISVPIDQYSFWVSPLSGLVELLNSCEIGNIAVTPFPSEPYEGATTHFTTAQSQATILGELIRLTKYLSPADIPYEVEDQPDLNAIAYTLYQFSISSAPDPNDPVSGRLPPASCFVELLDTRDHGCYLRYGDSASFTNEWVKVSASIARGLIDYVTNATEPGTDGTVKENPFNSLIDLLYRDEIKTIAVTGPKGTAYYTGNDAARNLVCLQNAMQVVYRETSIVDVSDGVTYTIQLTPSEKTEDFNYRTIELFGGKYLRAPDHGITAWYEIDEGLAQALIDSFETGGPLDGWMLDSYALTVLDARCVQTGKKLAVTDGETLRKIADLLLSINGTALPLDYQTLEWLSAIDADPTSVADNATPLYIVTLRTNKDYSFYLFGDFLFADGRWWAIDHASTLESLIGGRSYTPPEDTLIKIVLEETEITSVSVMGERDEVLGGAGFELTEGDLGYIGALKDQLSSLPLTECEPKSGGICDLMIVIAHGGFTVTENGIELVDDKIVITLYDGRYLHFEVTSDESHWYEIPESEADELMTLLEKIRADLE